MKPPLDTDFEFPAVIAREDAAQRLLELLSAELADAVWDELVGPLYDVRALNIDWRYGKCRLCSVQHPGLWPSYRGLDGRPWPGHRMYCGKYAGPLTHQVAGGNHGFLGWRPQCACGQSWLEDPGDGTRQETCPDAAVDWRGPRPDGDQL